MPRQVLSITMSRGLRHSQVVWSRLFQRSIYMDDETFMWFDNGVENFEDLDEVMGLDDSENFDFDGNLDT